MICLCRESISQKGNPLSGMYELKYEAEKRIMVKTVLRLGSEKE
jgi:hypothetical protein